MAIFFMVLDKYFCLYHFVYIFIVQLLFALIFFNLIKSNTSFKLYEFQKSLKPLTIWAYGIPLFALPKLKFDSTFNITDKNVRTKKSHCLLEALTLIF